MAQEQPDPNIAQYESLSEDEADMLENENENTGPTTEGSVQVEKGTKRKRSKAWDTFELISGSKDERQGYMVRCIKCSYTVGYNSSFGTGNMLKHQKNCTSSSDIRQMLISSSQGSLMMMNKGAFDPKIFRDMITDVVEFDALDNDLSPALEKTELDRYLEEKRLNRTLEIDVLDYWGTNQFRFPNLALMARDVLTIPISTVASESAFSVGGRVLDQYRSCLAHNIVESLICTRDWKFNEEVYHNYTLEELTQDVMKLDIKDDHDNEV